jgi:hypothetical protein
MKIITAEIFHLYESCKGDIDRISSAGHSKNPAPLSDSLFAITSALQDIQLISSQRASDIYTARVLSNWKETCDEETYQLLAGRISFYSSFQSVADILQQIRCKTHAATDTTLAGFDSPAAFIQELKIDTINIRNCSFSTLEKIQIEFTLTHTYHELSIANDWVNEYLKLAEEFEQLYCKLIDPRKCAEKLNLAKRWWKFW